MSTFSRLCAGLALLGGVAAWFFPLQSFPDSRFASQDLWLTVSGFGAVLGWWVLFCLLLVFLTGVAFLFDLRSWAWALPACAAGLGLLGIGLYAAATASGHTIIWDGVLADGTPTGGLERAYPAIGAFLLIAAGSAATTAGVIRLATRRRLRPAGNRSR